MSLKGVGRKEGGKHGGEGVEKSDEVEWLG